MKALSYLLVLGLCATLTYAEIDDFYLEPAKSGEQAEELDDFYLEPASEDEDERFEDLGEY